MSEGERVVLTEFPKGTITQDGDYFFHGGRLIPYLLLDRPSCGPLYRRIPDAVPALEARIAELEGVIRVAGAAIKDLQDELYENHVRNRRVPKYITDLYDNATAASERIESALKPPTPAAAKET